ncbi:NAD(P)/FAD-dependent oxidoreductase [Lysobacter korlensis]|uniref:NAD(P)/FAD-dependent oxidoreductase n=1 Tax=Lysobacter korlensis TaxID=553636 RepID=A0ABV6RXW5_9GAMM
MATTDPADEIDVDVAVVGAGPAGLSAALVLARARRSVLVVDSNRPRNAATLASHGFLTRDGISPLELRKLGREELAQYPQVTFTQAVVESVRRGRDRFTLAAMSRTGAVQGRARIVVIATGLTEVLPELPTLRAFYGTSIHSCIECDAYEKRDEPLALIGESADLAERAVLLTQWTDDLIVFTNGSSAVTADEEDQLAKRGVRVERRPLADVEGDRSGLTGIRLADGEVVPRSGAFVRPVWVPAIDYAHPLKLKRDDAGLLVVDSEGRTNLPGVFAVGDSTPPGPQQLIVAAGAGAKAGSAINRMLLGLDNPALR